MTYLVSNYGKDDSLYPQRSARPIMTYLVSKYGKDDSLYPRDLRKRAVVDQRLHYSNDVVYVRPIMTYLVSKYGKDDSLYPRDLRKRAIVDQRLHYSNDVVYVLEISLVIQHCFCSRPIMTYLVSKYGKDDSLYPQRSAQESYRGSETSLEQRCGLCSSHHDVGHLVSKYGKDDSLYPRDLRKRAIVDQRLHYSNDVAYLVSKYGKDDSLYPRDLRKRAIVDQRLHYSNDVVYVLEISLVIQHCFCSRPIMTYLVSKYGKDDSLCPQRSA
ncbi:hypothetical protein J6590_078407 [Homalodisca vitripennis]|nr:hypothetical protein J6590_078407 [Homalodisca vitripennis]